MLALAADVASGLLHLHQHGVVHGDVKVRVCACVLRRSAPGTTPMSATQRL